MWLVWNALAGTGPAARLVVDGEVVVARHTDGFCAWPRVAGVTSPAAGDLPALAWDPVFDPSVLKGFTGLLRGEDPATGAVPLELSPTVTRPSRDAGPARAVLASCGLTALEPTALTELLRKSPVPARAVVAGALVAAALESRACADASVRGVLLAEAARCEQGSCDGLVARIATCR